MQRCRSECHLRCVYVVLVSTRAIHSPRATPKIEELRCGL